MEPRLPDDVRDFLRTHVRSMGQLEVLLLLERDPERWWTAEGVNLELKTSFHSALKHLEDLRNSRLVQERTTTDREFRYDPEDSALVPVVRTLSLLFKDWIATIVDVIYTPGNASIREFADAFRLGKKGRPRDG